MTLIRLIRRRISRIVSMLLIRSTLRRIALALRRHLGRLLLLRRNSRTSTRTARLPWDGWSLVGRCLTGGRSRRRGYLRCSSAITSGRRRLLLIGWRRMGLACGWSCRRLPRGTLLLLLLRRRRLLVRGRTLRRSATPNGSGRLIRTCSLSRLTGVSRITRFVTGQGTGWSSGTSRRNAVHWWTTAVLEDVRRRKQRLDIVLWIG